MLYLFGLVMATAFAVALSAVVGALSQAKTIIAALEGTARQPEASANLRMLLIIGLAFIESLTIYVLVISFMLLPRLPETAKILELMK